IISAETERELRAAAEELARGAPIGGDVDVSLEPDAPPVFPGAMTAEPAPTGNLPVTSSPADVDLESMLTDPTSAPPADLRAMVSGTNPEDMAALLPPVVAPHDDPLAPQLPLSMEEPPPVSRISMDQLMPDPKALEALQKLAGAAGHPDRTRKALTGAFNGTSYDPRHLPDARVMLVGIARVLVAHGLPADEMIEEIMASLTD
ncbi:MAG TPA: hypothetical protein VLC93_20165, partial [Myxococcota bacterium]|nr:hypothetical protein [Myxococcota bacterium]